MRKLAKLAIVMVAVVFWGLFIIHLAVDHTTSVWQQAFLLGGGVVIPVLVVAKDWRAL